MHRVTDGGRVLVIALTEGAAAAGTVSLHAYRRIITAVQIPVADRDRGRSGRPPRRCARNGRIAPDTPGRKGGWRNDRDFGYREAHGWDRLAGIAAASLSNRSAARAYWLGPTDPPNHLPPGHRAGAHPFLVPDTGATPRENHAG